MKNIVRILELETKNLLEDYLDQTAFWSRNEFERVEAIALVYQADGARKVLGSKKYYEAQKFLTRKGYAIIHAGMINYGVENSMLAIKHYNEAILKLAFRITKLNLILTNLTVSQAKIGVNINLTITDGVQTVRAYTIRASGPIQRPHLRYLIK